MARSSVQASAVLLLLIAAASSPASPSPLDEDDDGLADRLEQELLEKFAPTLLISKAECDLAPAEFAPGTRDPRVVARNGTLYGQVFRSQLARDSSALIEIHYFHLWSRDCGRAGHALDAEHISALVRADAFDRPAREWTATYWYAAAHEDTLCDVSNGAKAHDVGAQHSGPSVWISQGKHASFLSRGSCSWGCGSDRCDGGTALHPLKLVNLGEVGAPLNGATWVRSPQWPLAAKMRPDFDELVVARLERSDSAGVILTNTPLRTAQAVFIAGNSTYTALDTSSRKTGGALSAAGDNTDRAIESSQRSTGEALSTAGAKTAGALSTSAKHVGKSLRKATRSVGGFLGIRRK